MTTSDRLTVRIGRGGRSAVIAGIVMVLSIVAVPIPAQQALDAGSLLREIERATGKQEMAPAPLAPIEHPSTEAPLPQKVGQTVFVASFRFKATRFSEDELRTVLKDYVGRSLTLAELQEATRKISDYYRQHDYLAHAYLPPQTVRNGVIEIVVVEGRLGQVRIDPSSTTRLDYSLATDLVGFRAGVGQWLRPTKLAEAMRVLNEIPGVKATSTLAPGRAESESVAVLKIENGPLVNGSVTIDNGGSHATGAERVLTSVAIDDPFGHGEQFSVVGLKSSGSTYTRLGITMPVGVSGLTLGANGSALGYKVGEAFAPLDLNGYAWTLGLTATYPITRSPDFSLTASASFDHKRMVDWGSDTILDDRRLEVCTLGLSAMVKDGWMGGGTNWLGATVTIGQVDLTPQQEKFLADEATARTNGTFEKLVLTATREQPLVDTVTLMASFQVQVAYPNLDGSEQFSLGGQNGIRAYPASEASGDGGWMNTLEVRWKALDKFHLFGFYDIGRIHQHNRLWTGWQPVPDQSNDYVLQGAGLGMTWSPYPNVQIKGALAHTLGDNAGHDAAGNDSDGTHDRVRSWIQAVINF
ncbi:conserved hypothetical protein [Gammaproteobacteria bacterium]